jgi:hypothetical protein
MNQYQTEKLLESCVYAKTNQPEVNAGLLRVDVVDNCGIDNNQPRKIII